MYRNTMFCGAISHSVSKLNTLSPQKKKKKLKKKTNFNRKWAQEEKMFTFLQISQFNCKAHLRDQCYYSNSHFTPSGIGGLWVLVRRGTSKHCFLHQEGFTTKKSSKLKSVLSCLIWFIFWLKFHLSWWMSN